MVALRDAEEIQEWVVGLPLTVPELRDAVACPIAWLRMSGDGFELYADVLGEQHAQRFGVLARSAPRQLLVELYAATAPGNVRTDRLVGILTKLGVH